VAVTGDVRAGSLRPASDTSLRPQGLHAGRARGRRRRCAEINREAELEHVVCEFCCGADYILNVVPA